MTKTGAGTRTQGRHAAGRPSPAAPRRPRTDGFGGKRRLELIGLAIGLIAGLGLSLVYLVPSGGTPSGNASSNGDSTGPVDVPQQQAAGPSAASLDGEWATYSDRSSCADWAGGDGVSAVRLSSSQIAWFFSDTYLGPAGPSAGFSKSSGFLHNSVVIQSASGQGSRFVTMTGGGACASPGHALGPPRAVVAQPQVPGDPGDRYWDEDGILIGGTVVRFYNRYLAGGFPFVPAGTVIAAFPASQLRAAGDGPAYGVVARPSVSTLPSYIPPAGGSPIVWGAALLRSGNTVYVYGTQNSQLYLARVPASQLTEFTAWRFYTGTTWAADQQQAVPVQPPGSALSVPSGFSVIRAGGRYWLIQIAPAGRTGDITAYPAAQPWGPFDPSAGILLYHDSGIGLDVAHDYRIMYEARVEPALSTSRTLVLSYNENSEAVSAGCVPLSVLTNTVTLPRFVTVPLSALTGPGTASGTVSGSDPGTAYPGTGPQGYPQVTAHDPSQWFNGWNYQRSGGCPPVPPVTSVIARPAAAAGDVTLTWSNAGLGVRYQVYLLAPGAPGYSLQATKYSGQVTLASLPPGTYQAEVVPLNFHQQSGHPATVTFAITS